MPGAVGRGVRRAGPRPSATEIRSHVEAGQTDEEIRAYLASRYGDDILLRPEGSGVGGLVWALPVAALVAGLAGLVLAFRRWRRARGAAC